MSHPDKFNKTQLAFLLVFLFCLLPTSSVDAQTFSSRTSSEVLLKTLPLEMKGDIASNMVDGVDRFLLSKLDKSRKERSHYWNRDFSFGKRYSKSLDPNRKRLAHILGVRDTRVPYPSPELITRPHRPAKIGQGKSYDIKAIRWPSIGDMHGEGLMLLPRERTPVAFVIAIPDADQTPEQIVGLVPGVPPQSQFARRLAESGCKVIVPTLISRKMQNRNNDRSSTPRKRGKTNLTNREFIYRSAFELGRHILGYEIQKILALVDWLSRQPGYKDTRIGLFGHGEGGALALYSAALDTRIDVALISGYFSDRRGLWQEPIDRNVFGLLEQFGDAELAAMISPRPLIIEAAQSPELELPSRGGAPAWLTTPPLDTVRQEVNRAQNMVINLDPKPMIKLVISGPSGIGPPGSEDALQSLLEILAKKARLVRLGPSPTSLVDSFDLDLRMARQIHEMDRHNQWLLAESPRVRQEFMQKLDTTSLKNYQESVRHYREFFRKEIIGSFDEQRLAPNARSRKIYDTPKWSGYEVVLDVYPDVIAYGILLLPKQLDPKIRRPVVVCQHGLEARPQDTIIGDHKSYHNFAAKLAERGFITFAPQNLYIFKDRFRTLQRKANPIKKTLFSVITAQHQQILDWLKTLPWVDPNRIAFYGLSYGGKTAMRVPALLTDYSLSICSADFNDWIWKTSSTRSKYSYIWTGEYEIFEYNLGSTFNYSEMAALIAPRPFMVERGHFDGVAPDERVAYEFAKVRHLYAARLGLADRTEIEWFTGPHAINGKGTFEFLHKHLDWPEKRTQIR